jgi:hypothetical protein
MANQVNRHDELRALLERLNLGAMAAVFADLALKAAKENISHEAYLFELGKHEEELRTEARAPHDSCVLQPFPQTRPFAPSIWESSRRSSSFRLSASKAAAF